MEVLRELGSDESLHRGGLGVVRIAERLGREKSQVSRALRGLEAEDLVERDPRTRTYQLGWGLYMLAARGVETRLVRAASALLYRLADQQRADVRLCVLIGGQVLTLISVPTNDACRPEPATESPCGPVLTLDWSDGALRDLVTSGASDRDNLIAHHTLLASSAHARTHGYAQQQGTAADPASHAAAVRDFRGIVLAAIQVTERPGERPGPNSPPNSEAVVGAANALSSTLGFEGAPTAQS